MDRSCDLERDPVDRRLDARVEQFDDQHQQHRAGQQRHLDPAAAEPEGQRQQHGREPDLLAEGALAAVGASPARRSNSRRRGSRGRFRCGPCADWSCGPDSAVGRRRSAAHGACTASTARAADHVVPELPLRVQARQQRVDGDAGDQHGRDGRPRRAGRPATAPRSAGQEPQPAQQVARERARAGDTGCAGAVDERGCARPSSRPSARRATRTRRSRCRARRTGRPAGRAGRAGRGAAGSGSRTASRRSSARRTAARLRRRSRPGGATRRARAGSPRRGQPRRALIGAGTGSAVGVGGCGRARARAPCGAALGQQRRLVDEARRGGDLRQARSAGGSAAPGAWRPASSSRPAGPARTVGATALRGGARRTDWARCSTCCPAPDRAARTPGGSRSPAACRRRRRVRPAACAAPGAAPGRPPSALVAPAGTAGATPGSSGGRGRARSGVMRGPGRHARRTRCLLGRRAAWECVAAISSHFCLREASMPAQSRSSGLSTERCRGDAVPASEGPLRRAAGAERRAARPRRPATSAIERERRTAGARGAAHSRGVFRNSTKPASRVGRRRQVVGQQRRRRSRRPPRSARRVVPVLDQHQPADQRDQRQRRCRGAPTSPRRRPSTAAPAAETTRDGRPSGQRARPRARARAPARGRSAGARRCRRRGRRRARSGARPCGGRNGLRGPRGRRRWMQCVELFIVRFPLPAGPWPRHALPASSVS